MLFMNSDPKDAPAAEATIHPLLPLRDIVVFPGMISQLFVGRERSIAALEEAMAGSKEILLAAQRNAKTNDPVAEDIHSVGTIGDVRQLIRLPDGTVKVLVEGKRRAALGEFVQASPCFLVETRPLSEVVATGVTAEALMRSVQSTFDTYVKLNKKVAPEVLTTAQAIDDPSRLADTILAHLPTVKLSDRQSMLEELDPSVRLERLMELMQAEVEILQVEKKIRTREAPDGADPERVLLERANAGHPEGAGW